MTLTIILLIYCSISLTLIGIDFLDIKCKIRRLEKKIKELESKYHE